MSNSVKLKVKAKRIKAHVPDEGSIIYEYNDEAQQFEADKQQDLVKQKEVELEEEMKLRYETGFSEGFSEAKSELEKEFAAQLVQKSKEYYNVLAGFEGTLLEYEEAFNEIVLKASLKIAEKIIKREVENKSVIEETLKDASSKVLGANNVIIKIHPTDHEILEDEEKAKIIEQKFTRIRFEEDASIPVGGCLIETEIGNVDARINSQIEEISKQLELKLLDK
ncbi:MAG: hypothetical protein JEY94_18695 [Melioribacteraceae bacterium]|nr:hypothetical protein [Melioribacteraceae bacterium]